MAPDLLANDPALPKVDRLLAALRGAIAAGGEPVPQWREIIGDLATALEVAIARARHLDDRGREIDALTLVAELLLPPSEVEAAWLGEADQA